MFDQSSITELQITRSGSDLVISWASTAVSGTTFQVYCGRRLTWWGEDSSARFPWPPGSIDVDVGAVADGEGPTDFSGSLPEAPADRCSLTWLGGTFLDTGGGVAGYRVFGPPGPGQAVSFATSLADLPAYRGAITDGYDLGGYGLGGWGESASSYSWTSDRLSAGDWTFAVSPYDLAGNLCGTPTTATVTVASPPRPPAPDGLGRRLTYTLDAPSRVATLHWLPSPA